MEQQLPSPYENWLGVIACICYGMIATGHELTVSQMVPLVRKELARKHKGTGNYPTTKTIKSLLKNQILPPYVEKGVFQTKEYTAIVLPWGKCGLLDKPIASVTAKELYANASTIAQAIQHRLKLLVGECIVPQKVIAYRYSISTPLRMKNVIRSVARPTFADDRFYSQLSEEKMSYKEVSSYLSTVESLDSPTAYFARVDLAVHHLSTIGLHNTKPIIPGLWFVPCISKGPEPKRTMPFFGVYRPEKLDEIEWLTDPEKAIKFDGHSKRLEFFDPVLLFGAAFDATKLQIVHGFMNEYRISRVEIY